MRCRLPFAVALIWNAAIWRARHRSAHSNSEVS
jgi:hypothetical protein